MRSVALMAAKDFVESPAKGVKGFIIRDDTGDVVFRQYNEDKSAFVDYDLAAESVEIIIDDPGASLFKYAEGINMLDFSSKVMGRK